MSLESDGIKDDKSIIVSFIISTLTGVVLNLIMAAFSSRGFNFKVKLLPFSSPNDDKAYVASDGIPISIIPETVSFHVFVTLTVKFHSTSWPITTSP